jgi:hypothetical protein
MINAVAVAQEFYRAMGAGVPGHTPGTSEGADWWKVDQGHQKASGFLWFPKRHRPGRASTTP